MEIKILEVRDRATCMPVMAVKVDGDCNDQENWLLKKAGFGDAENRYYVYLIDIVNHVVQHDPYSWSRTLREAHKFIQENFDNITAGQVVDVEYILGESKQPKISDRYY